MMKGIWYILGYFGIAVCIVITYIGLVLMTVKIVKAVW